MKRVLFISPQPFFAWRGSPIRVRYNLESLAELGYDVDLLTLPIGEELSLAGVRVHRVANPLRVRQIPIGPSLPKLLFDVLLLCRGLRMARRGRYELIHGVEEAGLIGLLLARLSGARLVYEKHSDPASHRNGRLRNLLLRVYARLERIAASQADVVIATGEGLADQVKLHCMATPVHAIPDMASSRARPCPESVERLRQEMAGGEPRATLVSFVGSFAVYQGLDLLLQAIPLVLQRQPEVRFQIIGGSPQQIAERRQMLQRLGVAPEACRFLGMLPPETLPTYLAATDILVSPRQSGQNSPLKLLDYMRAGRAIVATDVAANRLILDHSRSLLVASAPEPLAEGILALARDPDRRRRLGGAARRHYKRAYGFERFKQRLAHCYQKVLLGGLGALGLRLWRKGDALRDEVLDLAIETCEFWLPTLI